MQVLEALVCFELVVAYAQLHWLARVDCVDGIEHKLLRVLGMGWQEVSSGAW